MYGKRWVLEVDIQKFFDKINRKWMIQNLYLPKKYITKLLDSGIIDQGKFSPSDAGVPQGGIISPTMANETLDGLENELLTSNGTYLARYADDFVVLGKTKKSVKDSLITVKNFLTIRGLEVHPDKTKIVHINDGFDFLGFNIKEYPDNAYKTGIKRGILLVQPSSESIITVKRKISETVKKYPNAKPGTLIRELNPILRGWSNYYRIGSSRSAFRNISKHVFTSLKYWIYHKHGRNQKRKNIRQYFKTITYGKYTNHWTFYGTNERNDEITLFQIGNVTKRNYNMISISNPRNPYLTTDLKYFEHRNRVEFQTSPLVDSRSRKVSKKQEGICPICNETFSPNDILQLHHIKSVKDGGTNKLRNLALYHAHCHKQLHSKPQLQKVKNFF
jgi:RNA-directed DNA polymerase